MEKGRDDVNTHMYFIYDLLVFIFLIVCEDQVSGIS